MQFKARQEAQKIILRRCGAIVTENERTFPGETFFQAATAFAELKKQGKNYLEIERVLNARN